jgi:hypothetical protein
MAKDSVITGGGRVFRYLVGGFVLALAVFGAVSGGPWGMVLTLATAGAVIMVGHRIFRPAITRESGAVVCHYEPWQETGGFGALIGIPLIGTGAIGVAFQSNSPFYGWAGVFLLAITPVSLFGFWRGRRRCLLRITPDVLNVPRPADGWTVFDIPRAAVQEITPSTATVGLGTKMPQVEIRYAAGGTGRGFGTVRVGPAPSRDTVWLTIEPDNLRAALQVWKDGDPNDPRLLDLVESVLRSGKTSAATPPEEL